MAEEAANSTRATKAVASKASPATKVPGEDVLKEWEKSLPTGPATITADALRAFIEWRMSKIYQPRLGGQIGGAQAINAQASSAVLKELKELADWLDAGSPPVSKYTAEQLAAYKAAKDAGIPIDIPPEVQNLL
jgi:hypothetical protein